MDGERLIIEQKVLQHHLPQNAFKFVDAVGENPHVLIAAKTNSSKVYTLRIDLNEFPSHPPRVFVTEMLKTRNGIALKDEDPAMNTLPSEHGFTRIKHFGISDWGPNISIYKVYIKCRLWLEMYELHLKTGNTLDYYLNH